MSVNSDNDSHVIPPHDDYDDQLSLDDDHGSDDGFDAEAERDLFDFDEEDRDDLDNRPLENMSILTRLFHHVSMIFEWLRGS